jgi:hypothetical protein
MCYQLYIAIVDYSEIGATYQLSSSPDLIVYRPTGSTWYWYGVQWKWSSSILFIIMYATPRTEVM